MSMILLISPFYIFSNRKKDYESPTNQSASGDECLPPVWPEAPVNIEVIYRLFYLQFEQAHFFFLFSGGGHHLFFSHALQHLAYLHYIS